MRVIRFPLTRLVIALCFLMLGVTAGYYLSDAVFWISGHDLFKWYDQFVQLILVCALSFLSYCLYVGLFEGRRVSELSMNAFAQTGTGVLVGIVFVSLTIAGIALFNGYHVSGWNHPEVMIPVFIMAVQAGIIEELLLRGVAFRIIEDALGTWWSMILTAFIFGFLHIWNDNASILSSISISITAGFVLALLYVITRKLWIVIGMHFAWNFTLGGFYGAPVSGGAVEGVLKSELSGPEWLTGGAFGPEASIIIVVISIILTIYLINRVIKEKKIIKPMWRRKSQMI
ncbi:MAG: CPBP family intramembrane metalloprotease [Bacteroidetes bacterium]|nr:CPBP family intramembrane metalloprotease [Bacteroidota bacterium]